MPREKVDASRHNARPASRNNPSPGSNSPEPPSLIGGGGSRDLRKLNSSKLVGTPPPIKREEDYCRDFSCGSPWTFHYNRQALQQHVRSWFADPEGLPYGKWGSIVNVLGIETVNEIIQVYKIKHEQMEAASDPILNRAKFFKHCRESVEQGMEARQNPADADKAWAALVPRKPDKDLKYTDDYARRWGKRG
jgi:hypothetical protein